MRAGVAVMINGDNGTATSRPVREVQDPADWPEYLPPFLDDALEFDPDGTLWVRRTGPAGAAPTYDVINAEGRVTRQVEFPPRTRLVGFGANGAVYVARSDEFDLEYLQRYRIN